MTSTPGAVEGKLDQSAPALDQPSDVEAKLALSARAFRLHRKSSLQSRSARLLKTADLLEEDADRLAEIVTVETGKLLREARAEALKCATVCRYYAENGPAFLADETLWLDEPRPLDHPGRIDKSSPVSSAQSRIVYEPIGAVLAVMPWNFPLWQVFRCAAPALMAGNTMLLKHAANVPCCAQAMVEIFYAAGFAQGVFQALFIETAQVAEVIADERVAAVTLTGSDAAGSAVASAAGKAIKKVVLELGGSDPFIVMPSADMAQTVATAVQARMINCGQSCIAAKRFLVADPIYNEWETRFVAAVEGLKVGEPRASETEIGPLASERFAIHLDDQVKRAVQAGAKVLTGGRRSSLGPAFYEPTVLVDLPRNSAVAREEFFGPVAIVHRIRSIEDAIELANDTPFGLGASIWTTDEAEQQRFIAEIDAGQIFINRMTASDPRVPFGGIKRSGFGRELGMWGMREFMNMKSVVYR